MSMGNKAISSNGTLLVAAAHHRVVIGRDALSGLSITRPRRFNLPEVAPLWRSGRSQGNVPFGNSPLGNKAAPAQITYGERGNQERRSRCALLLRCSPLPRWPRTMFPDAAGSQTSVPKCCARSQTTYRSRIFIASPPSCRCPHRAMQARCRELGRIFLGMSCRPRIGRSQSGREFVSRTPKSFHIVTDPGQMPALLGGAISRSMSWPPETASERYAPLDEGASAVPECIEWTTIAARRASRSACSV
jgi:hypothetical protein